MAGYAFTITRRVKNRYIPFLLLAILCAILPQEVFAGQISNVICTVATSLTGLTGKAVATLAIIALGAGALFNKISLGYAVGICFGIGILFGSGSIMQMMGLGNGNCAIGNSNFNFTCNGPNANGNIMDADNAFAQTQGAAQNANNGGIFARTLFVFKDTIGAAMSSMYCAVADSLRGALMAAITVVIIVFGVGIITGMVNFTLKDASIYLMKIALVWSFAMDPAWGIGIGYKFFVSFAEEGASIAMSAMTAATGQAAPTITSPDTIITNSINGVVNGDGGTINTALADVPLTCLGVLLPLAALLLLFMPFVIIFIILMIIQYIALFVKAMLGYLSALVLISFLFIFAPLFLGFALFRTTMPLFQSWIKFLTSFALQIVVMFGFMAFLAMLPIGQFFIHILHLLKEYDKTFEVFGASFPVHFCGVCDYTISATDIICNVHGSAPPNAGSDILEPYAKQAAAAGYMLSQPDSNGKLYWVISLLNLLHRTDFAQFIIAQVMALFLIGKVLEDFIKKAPQFAQSLGGLGVAVALGGGGASAGNGASVGYIGSEAVAAAYMSLKNGLTASGGAGRNPFRDEEGRINFNLFSIGRNIRYNTIRAPIADWANRLSAGVVGQRDEILDADSNVVGYHKREGGIVGGLLFGAYDQTTIEGKKKKLMIDRQRARIEERHVEFNQATAKVADTFAELQNANQQLEDLRNSSNAGTAANAAAKEVVKEKGALKKLDKDLADKNDQIAKLQQQINALENSANPDSAQLAQLLNQLAALQQEAATLERQQQEQKTVVRDANSVLDKILSEQDEVSRRMQALTDTGNQLDAKRQSLAEIESEIAALQASGTLDAVSLATLSVAMQRIKDEIAALEQNKEAQQKSLDETRNAMRHEEMDMAFKENAATKRRSEALNNHFIADEQTRREQKRLNSTIKSEERDIANAIDSRLGSKGVFEVRSSVDNEKLISGMDFVDYGDQDGTKAAYDEFQRDHHEMRLYGKLVSKLDSGGIDLHPEELARLKDNVSYSIDSLDSQLSNAYAYLDDGDRAALSSQIDSLRGMVGRADGQAALNQIEHQISAIGNSIAASAKNKT